MPKSWATCAIGRFDSNTRRTARSRNSSGYFLGLDIAGASPSARTEPGIRASKKFRVLHRRVTGELRRPAARLASTRGMESFMVRRSTPPSREDVDPRVLIQGPIWTISDLRIPLESWVEWPASGAL